MQNCINKLQDKIKCMIILNWNISGLSILWDGLDILSSVILYGSSLVAKRLKCLPLMRETWVWSLGQEDPLEKEMITLSSILAWAVPWMEEPGWLQSMDLQRVGHTWKRTLTVCIFHLTARGKFCKAWIGHDAFLCKSLNGLSLTLSTPETDSVLRTLQFLALSSPWF